MVKRTPTCRVKISGNRQRIEIVFSGIFFDATSDLSLMLINQRNCRGKQLFPKRYPCTCRGRSSSRTFGLTTPVIFTDFAVLKLQLKILIM
jgi:hypothetical protein